MNRAAYLERIGYDGPLEPTLETLAGLQRAHMLSVPFENLDIHLGRELVLDPDRVEEKVVGRRRGGWCFELNGLFCVLLRDLGFAVTMLGSKVISEEGESQDLVHLLLRVDLDQPYITDVGFGESSLEPIRYADVAGGDIASGDLTVRFTEVPRRIEDFAHQCHRLQTDPESHFVQKRTCTLATPRGRVTVSDLRLIETVEGERSERELAGDEEWRAVLADRFAIVL